LTDPEELPTRTIADERLPGYADLVDQLQRSPDVAAALEAEAGSRGLPVHATRGIVTPFASIVDLLRGRRHVEDLGVHPVEISWLELHVPRGSHGAVKWKTSTTTDASFSLEVFGSGFGRGRRIVWSMESDIPARSTCLKLIQLLDVQVDLYMVKERPAPTVNVVSARGRRLVSWNDCPYCSRRIDAVDDFEFERGPLIDLRTYDGRYTETFTRDLTEPVNVSLGLTVPTLPAVGDIGTLGVSLKREAQLSCNLVYEFTSGRCYQPYWHADRGSDLPYWSSS
jgi:hypothetical protein